MALSMTLRSGAHSAALKRTAAGKRQCSRVVVRAAPQNDDGTVAPTTTGTVFFGGKAYTPEEWDKEVASGAFVRPSAVQAAENAATSASFLSFNDVMAFNGTAPEIVNGRLAMLGFVSAVAAEMVSGEGVLKQWSEEPTGIAIAFLLFISGSLVTAFRPRRDEKLGPFTPQAELLNGRAAMIGFAAMLAIEVAMGKPLI
ncbi:hypothetical protein HYH02_001060 [Chlamydomonas schloesseri]|uniref:Uncharacterized protein n=1 Tax=Chlamydomonas schloesseri TaxID=2026947 RepID=A0A835WTP0_9CHLO|nr:hypothetical protein HYH02_001060 [Chlamydomonas schloesseri]|eukprot:KAG2454019.1 hypothetical protein HYH02_001060 [Chlamydomonas schloesseri]